MLQRGGLHAPSDLPRVGFRAPGAPAGTAPAGRPKRGGSGGAEVCGGGVADVLHLPGLVVVDMFNIV